MSTQTGLNVKANTIDVTAIGLDFLWLEITPRCNLNCVHCYAESDMSRALHGKLQLEDWNGLLTEASQLGCRKCQFIGGEPTLHPDLPKMISEAHKLGFEMIEVYTNGTHFTDKLKQCFKENGVCLAFSVYAADAATHDSITGHKRSFDRTISALRWAVEAGLQVRVGVVEMEQNKGQFQQTRARLEKEGVKQIKLDRIRGIGRGARSVSVESQIGELCGNCWRGSVCVCADGSVYPCVFSRFRPIGEFNQGLATIIKGNDLASFRTELFAGNPIAAQSAKSVAEGVDPCDPMCGPCNPTCNPADCSPATSPPNPPNCGPDHTCGPNTN